MKLMIIILVLCFVFVLYGYQWMCQQHEKTHVTFLKYYGVDADYDIYWFGLGGGKINANMEQMQSLPQEKLDIIRFFDAVNELVSYQYQALYWIISGMFMLIMFSWLYTMEEMN